MRKIDVILSIQYLRPGTRASSIVGPWSKCTFVRISFAPSCVHFWLSSDTARSRHEWDEGLKIARQVQDFSSSTGSHRGRPCALGAPPARRRTLRQRRQGGPTCAACFVTTFDFDQKYCPIKKIDFNWSSSKTITMKRTKVSKAVSRL